LNLLQRRHNAAPAYRSSAIRSTETTRFAFRSRMASVARRLAPPRPTRSRPSVTSRGPDYSPTGRRIMFRTDNGVTLAKLMIAHPTAVIPY
jgi:hypothetical protein